MAEKIDTNYRAEANKFARDTLGLVPLKGNQSSFEITNEMKDTIDLMKRFDKDEKEKADERFKESVKAMASLIQKSGDFTSAQNKLDEIAKNSGAEGEEFLKKTDKMSNESRSNMLKVMGSSAADAGLTAVTVGVAGFKSLYNVGLKYPLSIDRNPNRDKDTLFGSRRLKTTFQDDLVSLTNGGFRTLDSRYKNIDRAENENDMQRRIARRLAVYSKKDATMNADGSKNHFLKTGMFTRKRTVMVESENNISMNMNNPEKNIHVMVLLAKQKGWDSVSIDMVPERLRDMLVQELATAGISVTNETNLAISNTSAAPAPAKEVAPSSATQDISNPKEDKKDNVRVVEGSNVRLNTDKSDNPTCLNLAKAGLLKPVAMVQPDGTEKFSHYAAVVGASIDKINEQLPDAFNGTRYSNSSNADKDKDKNMRATNRSSYSRDDMGGM